MELPVKPMLNTVYRANWKNTKSAQLTETVGPTLSLKRVRARRFSATLTAAQSFVGKYVVLQRLRPQPACLEDRQARHAAHGEARHARRP